MIEEKLELYSDFFVTGEAAVAFEQKLSEFTGESIELERNQAE